MASVVRPRRAGAWLEGWRRAWQRARRPVAAIAHREGCWVVVAVVERVVAGPRGLGVAVVAAMAGTEAAGRQLQSPFRGRTQTREVPKGWVVGRVRVVAAVRVVPVGRVDGVEVARLHESLRVRSRAPLRQGLHTAARERERELNKRERARDLRVNTMVLLCGAMGWLLWCLLCAMLSLHLTDRL